MKKIMITAMILLIMLLTLGFTSASDDNVILASQDVDVQSSAVEIEDSQLQIGDYNSEVIGDEQNPIHFTGNTMIELSSTLGSCQDDDLIYLDNDVMQVENGTAYHIRKHITIDGQGHTIDLKGMSNAFVMRTNDIILKNIIFKNGHSDNGGAIKSNSDGSCTLVNCTFIDNFATNSGGAIYFNSLNNCTLVNCTFIDNFATSYGGAVYVLNELDLIGCNFINNSANYGGGLYTHSGLCNVNESVFTGNIATTQGGAIRVLNNPVNMEGCTFSNNIAEKGGAVFSHAGLCNVNNCVFTANVATKEGAAINAYSAPINLESCTFNNNIAENGGVYLNSDHSNVNNCNFTNNTAEQGAGIYSQSCNITNCYFDSNNAANDNFDSNNGNARGSALYIGGLSYLYNCEFVNNRALSINRTYGGAIYVKDYESNIVNCNFVNNTAQTSGGAIYSTTRPLKMNYCNFTGNKVIGASGYGGAVYTFDCNMANCNFINNTAGKYGGALYLYSGSCNLSYCNFINNSAVNLGDYSGSTGGAVYSYTYTNIDNCYFADNTAGSGGALSGSFAVNDCTFINNHAKANDGGAIHCQNDNGDVKFNVNLNNIVFINNTANRWGGTLFVYGEINNCSFINSNSKTNGGAIYLKDSSNADYISKVINCIFNNVTTVIDGGAVYSKQKIKVNNCSFTNASGRDGGAIYSLKEFNATNSSFINCAGRYGGAVYSFIYANVYDCIFVNNTATDHGGAVYGICDISDCTFINSSATKDGGAVYIKESSNGDDVSNIDNCIFNNTVSGRNGGVIYTKQHINVLNSIFIDSHAANDAGAIYCYGDANVTYHFNFDNVLFMNSDSGRIAGAIIGYGDMNNCSFINCHAQSNDGGAVNLRQSSNVTDCIFDNTSARNGGAIFSSQYSNVINCTFINASASTYGGALYRSNAYNCYFVDCSATRGSAIENGNASDSIFINCYNAKAIVYNGACENCIFIESPALYSNDVTVNVGETAILPVRILDKDGNDINGIAVNVQVYNGDAVIDSFTTQSGSNIAIDVEEGSHVVALTSRYVNPFNATITVNAPKPSPFISAPSVTSQYGENSTVTVYLASDVSGNVKFTVNGVSQRSKINKGIATYTVSGLRCGSYPVDISYGGNYKYAADTIRTTIQVNKASPILSIVADDVVYGENATITVYLGAGTSGNAHITVNGITQKAKIENSMATTSFTGLKAKTYDVSVRYAGNVNYVAQTSTTTLTVAKGTPIISVDAPDAEYGTTATITVDVYSDVPGNIKFTVNGVSEKVRISNGKAAYNVSGLKTGTYSITINYGGNANYNAQTLTTTLNIVKATPITSVSVENINVGDTAVVNVVFLDNVNGFVRITVNGVTERVQIVNGIASASFSNLKAGTYEVTAVYGGSTNFIAQTATASFSVNKISPGLGVAKRTVDGKTVLIAEIAADATGNVNFVVNGGTYKAKIVNGVATVTLPDFTPGTYTLKTSYGGNYKYLPETKTRTITIR